jgi:hypothetical protein
MILAAVPDLMFRSKISEAAKANGVEVRFVRDPEAMLREAPGASLVLVDLDHDALREAVPQLKGRVIGFGSHVYPERLAVCEEAMTRGQFARRLPELLT